MWSLCNLIEDTFEARVFDAYGANEVGRVSPKCHARNGYQIWEGSVIVEILNDGEQASIGEEGEIAVTNLTNHAMPFIRYNLEDQGMLIGDECRCGNTFSMMKISREGKSDVIHLSDGSIVSALAVSCHLGLISSIKQFQIAQEELDRFTVRITKEAKYQPKANEEIKRVLGKNWETWR
jgi:phenylacetate-CoA ligase